MSAKSITSLFLFSGNAQIILELQNLPMDTPVFPFSEKQLMSFGQSVKLLRNNSSKLIIFGAYSLELQRYFGIISVVMLLAGKRRGLFADETGNTKEITPFRTLFSVVTSLIIELITGLLLVCRTWIRII